MLCELAEALFDVLVDSFELGVFLSRSPLVAARRAWLAATLSLIEVILVLVFSLAGVSAASLGAVVASEAVGATAGKGSTGAAFFVALAP